MCKVLRMTFLASASYSDMVVSRRREAAARIKTCSMSRAKGPSADGSSRETAMERTVPTNPSPRRSGEARHLWIGTGAFCRLLRPESDDHDYGPSRRGPPLHPRFSCAQSGDLGRIRPCDLGRRDDFVFQAVDLEGYVADAKPFAQSSVDRVDDLRGLLDADAALDGQVSREHDEPGGDGPHVEVVNPSDTRDRANLMRNVLGLQTRRGALQDDSDRIPEEPNRARPDQEDDEDGDQRVEEDEPRPGDEDGRDHDAHGSEGVAVGMEEGPADVDVPPGRGTEQGHDCEVRGQAREAHREHGAPLDLPRLADPAVNRDQEGGGDRREQDRVDERREDLDPVVAEGHLRGMGPYCDSDRGQAQANCDGVRADVACVAQEGERAAPPAPNDLDQGGGRGDSERGGKTAFERCPRSVGFHRHISMMLPSRINCATRFTPQLDRTRSRPDP